MLELCNDQGFLADSDKEMIAELNYVIDQLSLHLVSKRELIDDVKETLYKYKDYVLADDKLNLEEKQLECYRVQPLIRNLNVC